MKTMARLFAVCLILLGWSMGAAYAELSVSVTISGPLDELLPLLQHLKDMGIGHGGGASGIHLEMNSVAVPVPSTPSPALAQSTAVPPVPPPLPKPVLGFSEAQSFPSTAKPGSAILVSVRVGDPDRQVDTIAATVVGTPGVVDLYDNGTHGDVTAADGIWSASITLNNAVKAGDYLVTITAYNRNGLAVMVPGPDKQEIPLSAQAKITVIP